MAVRSSTLLGRLEALRNDFGGEGGQRKLELLRQLARRKLDTAEQVYRLHECLCFLQAYPDGPGLLAQVEAMQAGFGKRGDLRRHRRALDDTGIVGTDTFYSFYWPTARWLAEHHPEHMVVDWAEFSQRDKVLGLLPLLMPFSEHPAFDMLSHEPREWLATLKGPRESDAAFLVRRFAAMPGNEFAREKFYEDLDVPIRLLPAPDTPTRTTAKLAGLPVFHQTVPLSRRRPKMRVEALRPPLRIRNLTPREGQRIIDAAIESMITRSRDLDAFAFGDPRDVRLVDCGNGLQFACIGQIPERRLLFEAVYGFLTIKNGVPIGYVLASSLFRSTEVAFNVFETFRGAEAAPILGRVLGVARHLFGADAFSIDPYQLGHDNEEGLKSGAWWFYCKLGFRPEDPDIRRLLRRELRRQRANAKYRSSLDTLQRLSADHVYLYLDTKAGGTRARKRDMLAKVPLGELGLRVSRLMGDRFGGDREKGVRTLAREAADLLGVRSQRNWSRGERLAWARWSPLIMLLPGVKRWGPVSRRALVRVVRAKGGRRESDFVVRFDAHLPLRRAILKLAASED